MAINLVAASIYLRMANISPRHLKLMTGAVDNNERSRIGVWDWGVQLSGLYQWPYQNRPKNNLDLKPCEDNYDSFDQLFISEINNDSVHFKEKITGFIYTTITTIPWVKRFYQCSYAMLWKNIGSICKVLLKSFPTLFRPNVGGAFSGHDVNKRAIQWLRIA